MWTADNPLGPWKNTNNDINPKVGSFFSKHRVIKAQENAVFVVPGKGGEEDIIVYTGDRWDSAPDKLKSHDFQYWQPLKFNDSNTPPTIAELTWEEWIEIQV